MSSLSVPKIRTSDYQNVMSTFLSYVLSNTDIKEPTRQYLSENGIARTEAYSAVLKSPEPIINLANELIKNIIESESVSYDTNEYQRQILGLSVLIGPILVTSAKLSKHFYENNKEDEQIISSFGKFMLFIIGLIVLFSLIINS